MTSGPLLTRLTAREAAQHILQAVGPLSTERVPLLEALGAVLAERIESPLDVPPWDNAAMDGYAVHADDVVLGAELHVTQTIPAGWSPTGALGRGECARIFTGAPIPRGADTVIRQEDTTPVPPDRVRINHDRDRAANVRRRGDDIAGGATVLKPGAELGAAQIGILASLAIADVTVHRMPRIAVMTTGDELADLSERRAILRGEKIASSNTYTMLAMAKAAGANPFDLGIASDDLADLRKRLEGAAMADLIVTSGAMSVGEHDHLRALMRETGNAMTFWRARMRPGGPVGFGRFAGRPWIGLPGNPVSTMVTFELFVRPAIRRMRGHRWVFRRATPVRVADRITAHAGLQHFLRVQISIEHGAVTARLTGSQSSGVLSSMAKADALLIVPEDRQEIEVGEVLPAIMLCETMHVEEPPF